MLWLCKNIYSSIEKILSVIYSQYTLTYVACSLYVFGLVTLKENTCTIVLPSKIFEWSLHDKNRLVNPPSMIALMLFFPKVVSEIERLFSLIDFLFAPYFDSFASIARVFCRTFCDI